MPLVELAVLVGTWTVVFTLAYAIERRWFSAGGTKSWKER